MRVLEIRTYELLAGAGAAFHRLVVEESVPMLRRWGVEVIAFGPSLDDEDSYYLIRGYPEPRGAEAQPGRLLRQRRVAARAQGGDRVPDREQPLDRAP